MTYYQDSLIGIFLFELSIKSLHPHNRFFITLSIRKRFFDMRYFHRLNNRRWLAIDIPIVKFAQARIGDDRIFIFKRYLNGINRPP